MRQQGMIRWLVGVRLGIALIAVLLVAARVEVGPISLLATGAAVVLIAALFSLSAVLHHWLSRQPPPIVVIVLQGGFVGSLIYAGEILGEYLCLPPDNTVWGWIEYGLIVGLLMTTAVRVSRASVSGPVVRAATVAVGLLAYLGWAVTLLSTVCVFSGTRRQLSVLVAEGEFADFAASGGHNFSVFLLEDRVGALFYHALLTVIVSAAIGTVMWAADRARLRR